MQHNWRYDLSDDQRFSEACPEAQLEGTRKVCWSGSARIAPLNWKSTPWCSLAARTPCVMSHAADAPNR